MSIGRTILRRAAWTGLVLAVPLVPACSGGGGGAAEPGWEPPSQAGMEFKRRLRLGIEQLRRNLPESARAEFDACARLRPDDPELLFQQARLLMATSPRPADIEAGIGLLQKVLSLRPQSVKAHRLLYELETRRRNEAAARAHRAAVFETYGQMGELEIASFARYYEGGSGPNLRLVEVREGAKNADDLRRFRQAVQGLYREGHYAPSRAVPVIEEILAKYPDLAAVRLYFAKMLVLGQIRVDYSNRPGLRPMASALIFDIARTELERVYDQVHPRSPMARDIIHMLSRVAMLMADYDESIALADLLLGDPRVAGDFRQFQIGRKGLARLKQERYAEAVALLEESLAGAPRNSRRELGHLWLLHLAHEGLGTPPDGRTAFRFRGDLALPGDPTPLRFEDAAAAYGIDKYDGLGPSAWGDYDRDGDYDLFVTGSDSYGALYRNDGERFTDVSREANLFRVQSGFSATWSDYDNDGWIDLHVGRDGWHGPIANSLFTNNRDGTFTETTDAAGLGDPGSTFVCQWSDYDRDGGVDLYMANGITGGGDTNTLYRNNLDGTFTDVTAAAGLREAPGTRTIGNCWGDYDDDGWPDLFVSGYETANRLYRNNGDGTFTDRAAEAGLLDDERLTTGYTCFFFDYDNDLDLDILRPALAPWNDVLLGLSDRYDDLPAQKKKAMLRHCTRLYRNNGDGTFTDVSVEAGFLHPNGAMGTGVADLDNDGYLDIYFGTGDPAIERMEPDRLYRNNGDGTFTDLTFAAGVANVGKGHGETFVDIDLDGDLEIYAPEGGFVHGDQFPNAFYLNLQESGNHWIHIDLEGTKSNRDALDTRIYVTAGGRTLMREKHNGEGFGSSNSPPVEFGLGRAAKIDRIEVRWPGSDPEIFTDLPVDRRIFIREGEGRWTGM